MIQNACLMAPAMNANAKIKAILESTAKTVIISFDISFKS